MGSPLASSILIASMRSRGLMLASSLSAMASRRARSVGRSTFGFLSLAADGLGQGLALGQSTCPVGAGLRVHAVPVEPVGQAAAARRAHVQQLARLAVLAGDAAL